MSSVRFKPQTAVPGSTNRASSRSTVEIYARLRWRMLQYIGPEGDRLVDYLGDERVYIWAAPNAVSYPHAVLRLTRNTTPWSNGYREQAELEVQVIGRPESQLPLVESAADLIDQCLTSLTDTSSGLMVGRSRTRQTVPRFTEPADSSVVAVQGVYSLLLWPQVLTTRAT